MIRRVFVFSDMGFDQACKGEEPDYWSYKSYTEEYDSIHKRIQEKTAQKWETDYEVIKGKFQEKGYRKIPGIVFWNLRNSSATPVSAGENGVALLSGFSKNLLTLFWEEGGIMSPEDVMEMAISGEEYKQLVLFD